MTDDEVPTPGGHVLRPVCDEDAPALIGLVASVYDEYPGCVLDLPGVDADLREPRSSIDAKDGELWVVDAPDEGLIACCGWAPVETDAVAAVELKRLYVHASARGRGLGRWLVGRVEDVARSVGRPVVELWSDTRFTDAHRLYERLGYRRLPGTRQLQDPSDTTEYHFRRELG